MCDEVKKWIRYLIFFFMVKSVRVEERWRFVRDKWVIIVLWALFLRHDSAETARIDVTPSLLQSQHNS